MKAEIPRPDIFINDEVKKYIAIQRSFADN